MQNQLSLPQDILYYDMPLDPSFPMDVSDFIQPHHAMQYLHYHGEYEIGLCLAGSGVFFVDQQMYPFQPGDVSLIPPNRPHIAQSPQGMTSHWLFITLDMDIWLREEIPLLHQLHQMAPAIPPILTPTMDQDLAHLIRMIADEGLHPAPASPAMISSLLTGTIIRILRCAAPSNPHIVNPPNSPPIAQALNFISAHYMEPMTVGQLAELCHLSESHFRTVFHQITGQSPWAYITDVRVRMAQSLLTSTSDPIIDIAQRVGYTTISSFNRAFRKLTGQSPRTWRNMKSNSTPS